MAAPQPAPAQPRPARRKRLGAWSTPEWMVDLVVGQTTTDGWVRRHDGPIRVLDPACGDGRFLAAAARRIADAGGRAHLTGVDVDPVVLIAARTVNRGTDAELHLADALERDWGEQKYDLVVGNPPFLSQLAAATTRRGASRHGGGPYADTAAEFLALSLRLVRPGGGRIGLVLPQSILASRDAGPVRSEADRSTTRLWSWWSPERHFDAEVVVCALGFEHRGETLTGRSTGGSDEPVWTEVVAEHLGVPAVPVLATDGTLADRADLNANFRDEYYGMVPAVGDHADGPPLVTTGLIDPGVCHWGRRPVRFSKRTFAAPRVDLARLDDRMRRWADRKLVPKVLVGSQTAVIEAVVDAEGEWLPGVPVTTATPRAAVDPWLVGAVLTSPVASTWAWHRAAGTGLSARALRLGPTVLAALPWPAGDLDAAADALRHGDLDACAGRTLTAYGVDPGTRAGRELLTWWRAGVSRARGGRRGATATDRSAVPR